MQVADIKDGRYGDEFDVSVCVLKSRRRSPIVQRKRKKPSSKRNVFGGVPLSSYKTRDSGEFTVANRIISFGKMPSYKYV